MRIQTSLLFCLLFSIHTVGNASPLNSFTATTAVTAKIVTPALTAASLATLKIREIEKITGRKLTLKEKLAVKLYLWKLKKAFRTKKEGDKSEKGTTAMIFGIAGLVLLFLPVPILGGVGAIVGIILALVMGYKAKKANPNDKHAKTAIVLGWIGVGLIILGVILLAALIISWTGG